MCVCRPIKTRVLHNSPVPRMVSVVYNSNVDKLKICNKMCRETGTHHNRHMVKCGGGAGGG